jgi:hypothetical protein
MDRIWLNSGRDAPVEVKMPGATRRASLEMW